MKGASLFLVFLLAKIAMVWGHAPPINGWSLLAFAWQDALVALAFSAIDFALENAGASTRIAWSIYWAATIYAAINIPVGRAVSTPLTLPMLRAARGPLSDSILLYVTPINVVLALLVLTAAAVLPLLLEPGLLRGSSPVRAPRPVPRNLAKWAVACASAILILGPFGSRRVDMRGMDRNVFTALIATRLPRGTAHAEAGDWRESRFETRHAAENLSRFAGIARGRNVVMVGLESTAAEYLSIYGGEYDVMPNLTTLSQRALVFDNAYAVYPESIKGLFSILCSTFPAFNSRPEDYENLECRSVAAVLGGAGYRTAMFHSGRFGYLGMQSIIGHSGYQRLEDAGDIGGNHNSSFGVGEPATVARMLGWIDTLPRGQHFFLTYLPIAGHHPYATPKPGPFDGSVEINQYRNALHYGDESLGALIEGLRTRGREDDTVWVIYGDHGEAFRQHEGNYGHTFFLYEENVHVPFLIAAPGLMPGQKRVRKVVSLADTAPTILDLMGIAPPASYQGRTMLPDTPRMALFFTDYSLGFLGLRDGPWKFVYEIGSGRTKLYDLERDPREMSDVSAREAARTSWYGQVVRGWSTEQKNYLALGIVH
jgi:hypothetical protein